MSDTQSLILINPLTKRNFIKYPKISQSVVSGQSHHQSQQGASLHTLCSSGRKEVLDAIKGSLHNCLSEKNLHLTVPGMKSKIRGKVREIYDGGDYLVLVTTCRQSAFDRILTCFYFIQRPGS
ncbi:hypothetical protein SLEP1_g20939 [Rubroshorea leprosula]|uniref:phosphoribosylaminoimidazolesuccinocarboxamide synthase n=1 Tax=Rubroshorea leprosula TaxID=152421 RepID=A0AAV5JDF4_9ROSI|nr:hypothetical protein SLEP1_g20939 [Rubroshorea leprosula]